MVSTNRSSVPRQSNQGGLYIVLQRSHRIRLLHPINRRRLLPKFPSPRPTKNESLKTKLITTFTETQEQQLLKDVELGDKKPSRLLGEIIALAREQGLMAPETTSTYTTSLRLEGRYEWRKVGLHRRQIDRNPNDKKMGGKHRHQRH